MKKDIPGNDTIYQAPEPPEAQRINPEDHLGLLGFTANVLYGSKWRDSVSLGVLISAMRRVAREVRHHGGDATYSREDMFQDGYLGLHTAAERFDPSAGFTFATYAVPMIAGYVSSRATEYLPVRMPPNVFGEYLSGRGKHSPIETIPNPTTPDYAGFDDGIRDDYVGADTFEDDIPLTSEYDAADEINGPNIDELIDIMDNRELIMSLIDRAKLDDRELEIILKRHGFAGESMTLERIGQEQGLTRERIRQIEAKALDKLRRAADRISASVDRKEPTANLVD